MTKNITQTANPNQLVTTNIQIRTEDLVAIKVAAFEHDLLTEQAQLEANIRDLKKDIVATEKSLRSEVDGLGAASFDPKDAIAELAKLGIKVKAVITADIHAESEVNGSRDKSVYCTLSIRKDESGYCSSWDSVKKIPLTEGIKSKQITIEADKAKLGDEQTKLVDVRRKLSQISTIERQARSRIAQDTLGKMDGGAALLASLGDIKGLPALPAPKK